MDSKFLKLIRIGSVVMLLVMGYAGWAQVTTNTLVLVKDAILHAEKETADNTALLQLAADKKWPLLITGKDSSVAYLSGIDKSGFPIYTTTTNVRAAFTTGTTALWSGGSLGLNLSGSSANMKGRLALWESGGIPYADHNELKGRITIKDGTSTISDHATHVAGTLIASGVNKNAKGMAFGAQELLAYNSTNHVSEMLTAAGGGLLISNHSYAVICGWYYNSTNSRWEFYGRPNENEDYKFGYYDNTAQMWDSISYNAPNYLIVNASGNNRDDNGPQVGQTYYRVNETGTWISQTRAAGISSNNGYDIIPSYGTAKNILTVGAVNPLSKAYAYPNDVVMTSFSIWGPTDDGRIKPDLVADGVNVLSSVTGAVNAYDYSNGTSMAAPNAGGSLFLLQEYYSQLNSGAFMRSSTLRGLAIHTTKEAGTSPGPDYSYGWGLLDVEKAARLIKGKDSIAVIRELTLNNGDSLTVPVIASGNGSLMATICWTDPKGNVITTPVSEMLNNTTPKLVHDLDIYIKKDNNIYYPWVLSPQAPSAPATKGINSLDNVERVDVDNSIPGETYTIVIKHKNTLQRSQQIVSLIVSGIMQQGYCSSAPGSTAGAKMDSVAIGSFTQKNVAGCTGYINSTGLASTITVEPGGTIPVFVRLTSCDATVTDKVVKIFADLNNDGDFTDAGETLATSNVINGNGQFSSTINIPENIAVYNTMRLRIVMQETAAIAGVAPCSGYTRGETQDYLVKVIVPSKDIAVTEFITPFEGDCGDMKAYIAVRLSNYGSTTVSNIPLTAVVKQGATTIATIIETVKLSIPAYESKIYTFQQPINLLPATEYAFNITSNVTNDQVIANNSLAASITTSARGTAPAGTASICSNTVNLKITSASTGYDLFKWYTTASSTTPIAVGDNETTTTLASTYYVSNFELGGNAGAATKATYGTGQYVNIGSANANSISFTALTPLIIKTAKLYTGHAGKVYIQLREIDKYTQNYYAYTYLDRGTTVVDVFPSSPVTPTIGQDIGTPSLDTGAVYDLGIVVPDAGNYVLSIYTEDASLYRNNNILTPPYPITSPGLISILGNNFTDYQKVYVGLYDMAIQPYGCPSPRTGVVATTVAAPVITQNGDDLTSTAAGSYQWYLNNVPISGAYLQTYKAIASGTYHVEATTNGCTQISNKLNVVATPVINVDPSEIGLTVIPNPVVNKMFVMQFETTTLGNLNINLVNTIGQTVYRFSQNNFSGKLVKEVNTNKLAAGVYYLQVIHDKKMYVKKVLIAE